MTIDRLLLRLGIARARAVTLGFVEIVKTYDDAIAAVAAGVRFHHHEHDDSVTVYMMSEPMPDRICGHTVPLVIRDPQPTRSARSRAARTRGDRRRRGAARPA